MKKKLKNITSASGKKNKADIVICAIIFTLSMGIMAGCFIANYCQLPATIHPLECFQVKYPLFLL